MMFCACCTISTGPEAELATVCQIVELLVTVQVVQEACEPPVSTIGQGVPDRQPTCNVLLM